MPPPSWPRIKWAQGSHCHPWVVLDPPLDSHPFSPPLFNCCLVFGSSSPHSPSGKEVRFQDDSFPPRLHHPCVL